MGYEAASKLWEVVNNRRVISMVKVGPKVEAQGLEIFFGYKDKTWGVVDCTSIALMRLLGCRQAFAFDEHFTEAGRQSGFEIIP